MEPKGKFQIEPMRILDRKVTMLRNRAIGQVKMQWEHYGPEEATWEMEDAMRLAHPFFVQFCGTLRRYQCSILANFALRIVLLKGEGNVTPQF